MLLPMFFLFLFLHHSPSFLSLFLAVDFPSALACLSEFPSRKYSQPGWQNVFEPENWFIWMFRETVWKRFYFHDSQMMKHWEAERRVGSKIPISSEGRGCTWSLGEGGLRGFRAESLQEGTWAELRGQ